jgi:4'-phosphopantetheinyl transferase
MKRAIAGSAGGRHTLPEPDAVHLWHGRPAPTRVARAVLAPYLGVGQDGLSFHEGPNGKPELDGRPLHFSKSTTRDRSLVAVTLRQAVGVDIERVRPVLDVVGLTTKAFGAEAAIAVGALPRERRDRAFLQAWTRLEAALKADGASLGRDARRYRIVWSADLRPAVLAIDGDRQSAGRIDIEDLDLGPLHVGAVAVVGRLGSIEHFRFGEDDAEAA